MRFEGTPAFVQHWHIDEISEAEDITARAVVENAVRAYAEQLGRTN